MEGRIGRRVDFEEGLLLKREEGRTSAGHWSPQCSTVD